MKNFKILSWLFAILLLFSHMHTNAVVINNPDGTKVWFNGCPPGETCPLSKADSIYLGIFQAITAVIQNTACSGSGVRNVDSIYQHYDTIFYAINGTTYYLPHSNNLFLDTAEIKYYTVLLSTNTPIVSPVTGATYLVGTSPTGVWASHAKDIAVWNGSSWTYYDGVQGDYLYNTDNALTYQFRSSNWVQTTGIPILNNGNTISTGVRLGTNNLKSLTFETNNIARGRIDSIGRFYVYDTSLRKSNKYLQIDSVTGRLIATVINGVSVMSDSQSLYINYGDSIRVGIMRGNSISFAYAYDSVSINATGDSLITYKANVRRGYLIASGSSGSTFNGLTGATGTNSINNADYSQEWKWNTLTNSGLNLTSTSSTLSANSSLFRVQLNTNQSTSGTAYYAAKFINRNVTGGGNTALYLNTPFGAPARALEVDTGEIYFAKNNSINWANGSSIASTTFMQLTAPTSGYMIFRSNSNNGFHFWNSSGSPFFTVYNASSTQHGTIFGGDYAGGSYRSIGTSATVIERNVGNLIFSANTGLSGSYASFTPNNIMTVSGTASNVGIGTTTPNASALLDLTSTTKTLKLMNMTATQASAISTPPKGSIIYVTDTNGTFTSAGLWMYGTSWKLILAE